MAVAQDFSRLVCLDSVCFRRYLADASVRLPGDHRLTDSGSFAETRSRRNDKIAPNRYDQLLKLCLIKLYRKDSCIDVWFRTLGCL